MSHEIYNGNAVFSSTEGKGWHGLGQVIPPEIAKNPLAIAKLCNALYTVEKRACYYKAADGSFKQFEDREIIVRTDTGAAFEAVSANRYHVDNRQPADMFAAFRDELNVHGLEISHAAVLNGGAEIAVCALLPSDCDITVGRSDSIKSYVTLSTGYNGKRATNCTKGSIRVVCQNTLTYSLERNQHKDSIRASSRIQEFSTLSRLISNVKNMVKAEQRLFDELANTRMTNDQVARYFADVLEINIDDLGKFKANGKSKLVSTKSENMLRALTAAYNAAPGAAIATGTAWGALNAVTYYATHEKGTRDTSGSGSEAARVRSNMTGDAAKFKARALQMAANLVAVAA